MEHFRTKGSLPLQEVLVSASQPIQVYGNVGVPQPISVYFQAPQPVTIPEPVSVYGNLTASVAIPQPLQVYGNVGVAQPVSIYGNIGVFQPLGVYFNVPQPVTVPGTVNIYGIDQPVSVYGPVINSPNIVKNGNFSPGNFYGWDNTFASIAPYPYQNGAFMAVLSQSGSLLQYLPGYYATKFRLAFIASSVSGITGNLAVTFYFTDGTNQTLQFNAPIYPTFIQFFANPTTPNERLAGFEIINATSFFTPDTVYITDIVGAIVDDDAKGNINVNLAEATTALSVYFATPQQIFGNVGVAQPISVYFNTPQAVTIPEPVSVYFASPQAVTATVSIPQPLSVYAPSPLPVVAAQPGLQVYGNVGVFQPVSVYFQTPQSVTVSVPQPPFQVYGSQPGVQVYGNVGVFQPVSVYFQTPQSVTVSVPQPPFQVYGSQPGVQVYGNVGVAQPISVYFGTPQVISVNQPLSVYAATKVGLQVYGNVNVFQPVAVYSSPNTPAVNVYDAQVVTDTNQVFAGQIGAGSGLNSQIVAPTAGQSLEATLIDIWNIYGAVETVALRFGSTGQFRFIKKLNPNTGFAVNLINSTWRGPTNTGLYIYTWETMGGPLSASGGFVTYTVMGQYLP
jgi:hypothetical protein